MNAEFAFETHQLCKQYDPILAVDRVDLAVPSGSVFGLLGPNGAGKTTLMRMAFGLVQPTSGEIFTFGRSFANDGVAALADVAGFVETPRFYPYLSGRENLRILARLDRNVRMSEVDGVLETVDLSVRGRDRVSTYSYGMVQRLGVAAALLRKPRLLVVDEPTNGLDPAGIREMRALIRRLADSGPTVLLSSHNMLEVADLCDRVAIMSHGRIVFDGTMAELHDEAPEPVYTIATSDDARALEIARGIRGVDLLSRNGRGLEVSSSDATLDALIRELVDSGIGIRLVAPRETPLETLFFRLTGHGDLYVDSHSATEVAS